MTTRMAGKRHPNGSVVPGQVDMSEVHQRVVDIMADDPLARKSKDVVHKRLASWYGIHVLRYDLVTCAGQNQRSD